MSHPHNGSNNNTTSPITLALTTPPPNPHHKICIHTSCKKSQPGFIDKLVWNSSQTIDVLFWHSSSLIKTASKCFNFAQSRLDTIAYQLALLVPVVKKREKKARVQQQTIPKSTPTTTSLNHSPPHSHIRPKPQSNSHRDDIPGGGSGSGFFLLYTRILDLFNQFLSTVYSNFLPTFIRNRLDPILTFLKRQPLYQYYSFSLYHAPLMLLITTSVNYILPIVLEGLPWYLSPRLLSKANRNQRALLQQQLASPLVQAVLDGGRGSPSSSSSSPSSPLTPGVFPSHLLHRNAPPPTLPPHLSSSGKFEPPNLWVYLATALWGATVNETLKNLRIWVDLSSRSTIQRLALHSMLTRYEIPNNGNGNNYSVMNDPVGVQSLFIATGHANFLIPNIIRRSYALYRDATDLYRQHFSFNTFPFVLIVQPLFLGVLTEFISVLRSYIKPPMVLSPLINSHNFFNTVSSSLGDIKGLNLQSKQFEILTRISQNDLIFRKGPGPLTIVDGVLNWVQWSGLLDDVSRSILAGYIAGIDAGIGFDVGGGRGSDKVQQQPEGKGLSSSSPSSSSLQSIGHDGRNQSDGNDNGNDTTPTMQISSQLTTILPHTTSTTAPDGDQILNAVLHSPPTIPSIDITTSVDRDITTTTSTATTSESTQRLQIDPNSTSIPTQSPSNLALRKLQPSNTSPLLSASSSSSSPPSSIIQISNTTPRQTPFQRFLFGGIDNSDSYVIIYKEIQHLVETVSVIYRETLEVLGFMLNRPPLAQKELSTTWGELIEAEVAEAMVETLSSLSTTTTTTTITDPTTNISTTTTTTLPLTQLTPQQHVDLVEMKYKDIRMMRFYTSFDSIKINSIHYTYPDPSSTIRYAPNQYSEVVYAKFMTLFGSVFGGKGEGPSEGNGDDQGNNNSNNNERGNNPQPTSPNDQLISNTKSPALMINVSDHGNECVIQRGKIYLCFGVNTSGKSTLAQVLARFLMAEEDLPAITMGREGTDNKNGGGRGKDSSGLPNQGQNGQSDSNQSTNANHIDLLLNLTLTPTPNTTTSHTSSSNPISLSLPHIHVPLQHYRRHILYLKQKPFIFSATLIDNITGSDHTYNPLINDPEFNGFAPYSHNNKLISLNQCKGDLVRFLQQPIQCVCGCECGLVHCSKQRIVGGGLVRGEPNGTSQRPTSSSSTSTTSTIKPLKQLPTKDCQLTLQSLFWSMYMAGIYNNNGKLDSELDQNLVKSVDDTLVGENGQQQSGDLSDFFQPGAVAQRKWLPNTTATGSFVNRVMHNTIGFNPLARWTEGGNNDNDASNHQQFDCDCICRCEECLHGHVDDVKSGDGDRSTPFFPVNNNNNNSQPAPLHHCQNNNHHNLPILSNPNPIPTDPKLLWESINNIKPLTKEQMMSMSCDELITTISQSHPLLAFPTFKPQPNHDLCSVNTESPLEYEDSLDINAQQSTLQSQQSPQPILPPTSLLQMHITNNGGNVSGGFAQSIALARMFIRPHTQYIILDESLSMMDFRKFITVFPRITAFARAIGAAVIIISHHLRHIVQHSDYVVFMEGGQIRFFDKADVEPHLDDPELESLYKTLIES